MSYKNKLLNVMAEDYRKERLTMDIYGEEGPDDKLLIHRAFKAMQNMVAGKDHDGRMPTEVFDKLKDYKRYFEELLERLDKLQHNVTPIKEEKIVSKLALFKAMGNDLTVNDLRDYILKPYNLLIKDGVVDVVVEWLLNMDATAPKFNNNGLLKEILEIDTKEVKDWIHSDALFAMPCSYYGDKTIVLIIYPVNKQLHETIGRSSAINAINIVRNIGDTITNSKGAKYDNQDNKLGYDTLAFESISIDKDYSNPKTTNYKSLDIRDIEELCNLGIELAGYEPQLRKKSDYLDKQLSKIDPTVLKNIWKVYNVQKWIYMFPKLRNFIRGNLYHIVDSLELIKDICIASTESKDAKEE